MPNSLLMRFHPALWRASRHRLVLGFGFAVLAERWKLFEHDHFTSTLVL
jgi:hypothetical protein